MIKIDYNVTTFEQPSNKRKLKFRPFVVKEEKLLLMAKESNNFQTILLAVKQVIQNCCLETGFNVNTLTVFDLEYLFLKLRSISISNVQKFMSKDEEDGKEYHHVINLDDVQIVYPKEEVSNKIKANSDITLVLKYPTCDILDDKDLEEKIKKDGIFDIVLHCIDKVFFKDNVLKMGTKEKQELLDQLPIPVYKQIEAFLLNMPKLEYRIHWKNSLGTEKAWVFRSLKDFFLFL